MNFWSNKRVVITGVLGFPGTRAVAKLREPPTTEIFIARRVTFDPVEEASIVRLPSELQTHGLQVLDSILPP